MIARCKHEAVITEQLWLRQAAREGGGVAGAFKAFIHLLEARNVLVGLPTLPKSSWLLVRPHGKGIFWVYRDGGKHPNSVWWLSRVCHPAVTPPLGAQLGLRDVGWS